MRAATPIVRRVVREAGRRSGPGSLTRSGPTHPTDHLGFQPMATKKARAARPAATIESSIAFLSYLVLEPYGFHLATVVMDDGERVVRLEGRCVVFRCLRIRSPPRSELLVWPSKDVPGALHRSIRRPAALLLRRIISSTGRASC